MGDYKTRYRYLRGSFWIAAGIAVLAAAALWAWFILKNNRQSPPNQTNKNIPATSDEQEPQ